MDTEFYTKDKFVEICASLGLDPSILANETEYKWSTYAKDKGQLAQGTRNAWADRLREHMKKAKSSASTRVDAEAEVRNLAMDVRETPVTPPPTRKPDHHSSSLRETQTGMGTSSASAARQGEIIVEAAPRALGQAAQTLESAAGEKEMASAADPAPSVEVPPVLQGEVFLPFSEEDLLAQANKKIRGALGQMTAAVFVIGNCLAQVKARLGHGRFLKWIDTECCLRRREAQRYLRVWDEFGDKCAIMAHLGIATLDGLASKKLPVEIKDQILEELAEKPGALQDRELAQRLRAGREAASAVAPERPVCGEADSNRPSSAIATQRAFDLLAGTLDFSARRAFGRLLAQAELSALIQLLVEDGDDKPGSVTADKSPGERA